MAGVQDKNRLHVLCNNGRLKQIKELLSQDANSTKLINEPAGVFGFTPLHEAVSSRNADILQVLLTYGGHVDALSNGRYTPLHIAASIGDVDCIKVLLDFSANLSLFDEFGKTPYATAQLNRRKKAARILKTAEIKLLAGGNSPVLRSAIEGLQRGRDVEEKCFEDALELAVASNSGKAVGYLILHGARNVVQCMQAALMKPALNKTAVLLLLCHAAKTNDKDFVELMCTDLRTGKRSDLFDEKNGKVLIRKYLPTEWNQIMTGHKLAELRKAANSIDMAFPVTIACSLSHFKVAKIFLFEIYCKEAQGEADWHGLALNRVLPEWIKEKNHYKRLILSHNLLTSIPIEIIQMSNLSQLDLAKNFIDEVPKEIFELKLLRNLNLSSNEILFLPKVDNWSKAMKVLNLKENNLRFLDDSIEESELEDLNIADNNLSHVQSCICKIKTLQVLDFSRNKNITVLPPDLAKLSKLHYLGIEHMDQIIDPPPGLRAPTSVLLRHLKARLRNSEPYYTMKLMIVGLANRGKTTLMHRINRDFAFKDNQSTKGVDIREIIMQRAIFKCWDFAGQEEYYATHQCFLSQRSLYLLVWRVLDGEEGINGLKPWLDNLQSRVPNSFVIIVGTHLDGVTEAMKARGFDEEEMNRKVFELVSSYKEIHCQKQMIMTLTCSIEKAHIDECRRRIEKLRNIIYAVADSITVNGKPDGGKVLGEKVPSSYLTLAKMIEEKQAELSREGKLPLLRKCQFEDLVSENALKHPRDYFDPEDVELATRFLHDVGLILHYDDPNQDLRDLYFISPSWLCDLMAKIVTVREAHTFIREGILQERDIQHIIRNENRRFPKEFYPKYLRLLARFQIACRIDEERILVPSRLPEQSPVKITTGKEQNQTITRVHSFSFIPQGFWSRFISRFLLYLNEMLHVTRQKTREDNAGDDEQPREEDEAVDECTAENLQADLDAGKSSQMQNESMTNSKNFYSKDFESQEAEKSEPAPSDLEQSEPEPSDPETSRPEVSDLEQSELEQSERKSSKPEPSDPETLRPEVSDPDASGLKASGPGSLSPKAEEAVRTVTPPEVEGTGPRECFVNRVHEILLQDGSREGKIEEADSLQNEYEEKVDQKSYAKNTSFLINGLYLDNNVNSRYVTSSPYQDSREATPVSIGADSSTSSQRSSSSCDQSGTPSAQASQSSPQSVRAASVSSTRSDTSDYSAYSSPLPNGMQERDARETPLKFQPTCESTEYDSDEQFDEAVDISNLIDRKQLICWKYGVLLNHPKLFLSVSLVPSKDKRQLVETRVSRSLLGYRALAFSVDHIRTLVKEWFPGLEGTDGFEPYVRQFAPCPLCVDFGIDPPHEFDITDCLKESFTSNCLICMNNHTPKVVKLSEACPDLLFMDLQSSMQLVPTDLIFAETDDNLLGQGQFGKVYRGTYKDKPAAIKLYNFKVEMNPDLTEALDHFYEVRQEAVVLSRVKRHPCIITFYGVAVRPKLCLAVELATKGTLRDALKNPRESISRIVTYRIAQQIASAVSYLHSLGIIHRDLKSDNVLMFSLQGDSDVNIKLADFGTANFISPVGLKFFTGTPGFIAPEIFEYSKTEEYDSKVDVYSYAMVLYELISKRRPFHNANSAFEISNAIKEGKRPLFYDLKDVKYRLLTLAELMVKLWVQEAVRRPSAFDINRQLKSPSFCLLYGKTPLRAVNTPRQLCHVKSMNEVWVTCDDKTGASVLVVDLEKCSIKQKFVPENKSLAKAKESFFNISSIYDVDKQHVAIILRSASDYISIYSSERKRIVESYQISDNYIRSLATCDNYVIIGCEDGVFTRVGKKDFLRGKWRDKVSVVVNAKRSISAVITNEAETEVGNETKLLLGCDKYVYKYPLMFDDPDEVTHEGMRHGNEKNHVAEMSVSTDGETVFVSRVGSPIISVCLVETMEAIGTLDCSEKIRTLIPNCDSYDQRVTCFCVNGDTLWIGTGSGHILIYEILKDSSPSLITWLKPYKLEVRSIVSCRNPNKDPARYVITIGKELNPSALCYGGDGLCLLTGKFPVDPSNPSLGGKATSGSEKRKVSAPSNIGEFDKKMLLIWDGAEAAVLKKVVAVN